MLGTAIGSVIRGGAAAAARLATFIPKLMVRGRTLGSVPKSVWTTTLTRFRALNASKATGAVLWAGALWPLVTWALSVFKDIVSDEDSSRLARALGERVPNQAWSDKPLALSGEIRAFVGTDEAKKVLVVDAMRDAGFGFNIGSDDDGLISALSDSGLGDMIGEFLFTEDVRRMIGDEPGGSIMAAEDREWLNLLSDTSARTGLRARDIYDIQRLIASGRDERWNFVFAEQSRAASGRSVLRFG